MKSNIKECFNNVECKFSTGVILATVTEAVVKVAALHVAVAMRKLD